MAETSTPLKPLPGKPWMLEVEMGLAAHTCETRASRLQRVSNLGGRGWTMQLRSYFYNLIKVATQITRPPKLPLLPIPSIFADVYLFNMLDRTHHPHAEPHLPCLLYLSLYMDYFIEG